MKKTALLLFVVLLAVSASAQMHGGNMPGTPGNGTGTKPMSGNVLMLMPGLEVAADGTAIVADRVGVVAYTPNGTKAWTYTIDSPGAQVRVAGTLVLVTERLGGRSLTALNVSNGTKAWTLDLDGFGMHVEPAANQIYVLVTKVDGTTLTRELVAVSMSGSVLWRRTL